MTRNDKRRLTVFAAIVIFVALIAFVLLPYHRNNVEIRARYAELQAAVATGDTNAVLPLIAPAYRTSFDGHRLSRLSQFARPLGASSKVLILGRDATILPKPNWYLVVVPIGDTVEMTKVGGHWFFTGKVHLD